MTMEVRPETAAGHVPQHVKSIPVSPRFAQFIDGMWEWNVPDAAMGRAITGKLLPSLAPQFCLHYGAPMLCDRMRGTREYRQIAHGLQTKVVTVQPTGPIRAITVRFKPEAAPLFMGPCLDELRDRHVELCDLFPSSAISELVERLAEAADSAERVALVEWFLLWSMRHKLSDRTAFHAAVCLQNEWSLSVRALASQLEISERQLSRKFKAAYGVGPKQFARLMRMTRALELRQRGLGWLEIVSSCGFSDQAHLIRDFGGMVRLSPEHFFRTISSEKVRGMNASLTRSILSNTFVV